MNTMLFLGRIGTGELILIICAIVLLFGGKKIPELMKGIGKGIKSFKDGMKGIEGEINSEEEHKKNDISE